MKNKKKKHSIEESDVLYIVLLAMTVLMILSYMLLHLLHLEHVIETPCIFRVLTGIYCPGCGGTRALKALMRGQILLSLKLHPLIVYIVLFLVFFLGSNTLKYLSDRKIAGLRYKNRYLFAGIIIMLLNWIIKNYYLIIKGIDLLA